MSPENAQLPGLPWNARTAARRLLGLALGLGLVLALVAPSRSTPIEPASRVVSLDLCSDWLLTSMAIAPDRVLLSPLSRRHRAPWMTTEWPAHDGSLEQILEHQPGLVLVGEFNASLLRARLERLGLKVLVTRQPPTLAAIEDHLRLVKAALEIAGIPTATDFAVTAAASDPARLPDRDPSPRALRLLLLAPNGFGAGTQTFEADLIRRAGWRNYLDQPGHQTLDLERLVIEPPDAVVWAAPPHAALANRFAQHRALLRALPTERWLITDYWRWQCPGPWSIGLLKQLQP